MLTSRRLLIGIPLLLLIAAGIYTALLVMQVRGDLEDARDAGEQLRAGIRDRDADTRDGAATELAAAASSAADRTDGTWWSVMTAAPVLGDDASAVRALSQSLDIAAEGGVEPLGVALDLLPQLSADGRVDLDVVAQLRGPVGNAHVAMREASLEVSEVETGDLAGPLRGPISEYVDLVRGAEAALASSVTATDVLPSMLGGREQRRYLLVFQNNAEIRATGGLPGSWSVVEASDGELELTSQGAGAAFGATDRPVLPLSDAERKIFGPQLGTYFLDANFTPDFPRAAELWQARWDQVYPEQNLDGVVSLDPIALSYLLAGTGPIDTDGQTLTPDSLVEALLSRPYLELDPTAQDLLFAEIARTIFDAVSGDLADPLAFVEGLSRAAAEGRFRVAAFTDDDAEQLADTRVVGALAGDDGATPHVDIGLNDATGSKMSYYLRYYGAITARGCTDGVQSLSGSLTLRQSISPQDAQELPDSVTGTGEYGTERGSQLVLVRIHAPFGGSFEGISLDGKRLDKQVEVVELNGRQVATVTVLLSSTDESVLNWGMETGAGQTGDGRFEMTPSVVPGRNEWSIPSAC